MTSFEIFEEGYVQVFSSFGDGISGIRTNKTHPKSSESTDQHACAIVMSRYRQKIPYHTEENATGV